MGVGGEQLVWGQSPLVLATSHTSLPKSGSERVALWFSAQHKCAHSQKDCTHGHPTGLLTHAEPRHTHYICTHGLSATTRGLEGHKKRHTIFLCILRHTHAYALTWSLSHTVTYKHRCRQPHTRLPPRFLQVQEDREGGPGRPGHCRECPTPPSQDPS